MRNQSVNEYGAIVLGPMNKTQNHDGQDWRDYHAIPYHRSNQGRIKLNNIPEIEIALRNGLIDELSQHLDKSVEIIKRLINVVNHYQETIEGAFDQNKDIIETLAECIEQRDRARATAVRLEQECHSCMDTVHHGNEEVYEGEI